MRRHADWAVTMGCADARAYAVALAEHRVRDCLRAETCVELEGRR
jgi:hypothetical protein